MALSASDIRAALSLQQSSSAGPSQVKKTTIPSAKRPEGIPRELYALIGDSTPTLATQLTKPRLKQKPNLSGGSKVHWEWRSFTNPARGKDPLQLFHWVKVSGDNRGSSSEPYAFAKFNTPAVEFTYTNDEYNSYLEDSDWPRAETDYLFQLVREYDLRWYIIYDRYDFPGSSSRTMEDLKDRYYSACRKLVRSRQYDDESTKSALMSGLQFDKERENTRKKYIHSLESRTADQKAEEEALYIELKRLEQNERRFRREREELLRTLAGIESGLPDTVEDDSAIQTLVQDMKRKKRGLEIDSTTSSAVVGAHAGAALKGRTVPKNAVYDAQHCITRVEPTTSNAIVTKNAHTPAFLRSYKLPTPKTSVYGKVTELLKEVNVNPTRLVMATRQNCLKLEAVIEAASNVVEMKKQLDKLDYELSLVKERTAATLKLENGAGEGEGSKGMVGTGGKMGIDVDDGEIGEDGRGQSVLSSRSRSRKKTRSGSISSVDTTQNKRQRRN